MPASAPEAALEECRAEQAALPAALRAFPHSQALDDEFGRVDDVRFAALRRLLRVPAPDLAALASKIELIVADQAWELTGAERCLERLRDDARRLAELPTTNFAYPKSRLESDLADC